MVISGEGDLKVEIAESDLARNVFAKMGNLQCIYTIQLIPRTDKSSLEIVLFDHEADEEERKISSKVINFFTRNKVSSKSEIIPKRISIFTGADPDTSYTAKVKIK